MRYSIRKLLTGLVAAGIALAVLSSLAAADNWAATINDDPPVVGVNPVATDGAAELSGGCNKLLGPGFMATLFNYAGDALQRIDDGREPVVFEITDRSGNAQTFDGHMHYFDGAWVISEALPAAFFEPLARGVVLTIRNRNGIDVVSFDLTGSARTVEAIRRAGAR